MSRTLEQAQKNALRGRLTPPARAAKYASTRSAVIERMERAVMRMDGNVKRAAASLRWSERTFWRWTRTYGLLERFRTIRRAAQARARSRRF